MCAHEIGVVVVVVVVYVCSIHMIFMPTPPTVCAQQLLIGVLISVFPRAACSRCVLPLV